MCGGATLRGGCPRELPCNEEVGDPRGLVGRKQVSGGIRQIQDVGGKSGDGKLGGNTFQLGVRVLILKLLLQSLIEDRIHFHRGGGGRLRNGCLCRSITLVQEGKSCAGGIFSCKGEKDPIQMTVASKHGISIAKIKSFPCLFHELFFRLRRGGGYDQLFSCSGHGNVQQAHFLFLLLGVDGACDGFLHGRIDVSEARAVRDLHGNTRWIIKQQTLSLIRGIELISAAEKNTNGKFQPLGLVDVHQIDTIGGAALGGTCNLFPILDQTVDQLDEIV